MNSLMAPNFLWSVKKLHNQNQNSISEYWNANARSTYSYNDGDITATNVYYVLTVVYVLNILHALIASFNLTTAL